MAKHSRLHHFALPLAVVALALALPAPSSVLYRSIGRDGTVTFSDAPIDNAVTVQRIEMSDSGNPAVAAAPTPQRSALADALDESIARANAKVDLAEHALALARQAIAISADPLLIGVPRLSRDEAQRIEFFKRDVRDARRELMYALQRRSSATLLANS